jgi:hypothetical protein
MIEQIVEHRVFRQQDFRDLHGLIGSKLPAQQITAPPELRQPFLAFLFDTGANLRAVLFPPARV